MIARGTLRNMPQSRKKANLNVYPKPQCNAFLHPELFSYPTVVSFRHLYRPALPAAETIIESATGVGREIVNLEINVSQSILVLSLRAFVVTEIKGMISILLQLIY